MGYSSKAYEVFLQGSYGNDTNIYAESDVDVVIKLDSNYYHEVSLLTPPQQALFQSPATSTFYAPATYQMDVTQALRAAFGHSVSPENKAVKVPASSGRRAVDVIPAFQFRRYYQAPGFPFPLYHEGISFFTSGGQQINNFPKQHSANLTAKHQATNEKFKPLVRILKNMRTVLLDRRMISKDIGELIFH